jgi:dihydrofolate reductase
MKKPVISAIASIGQNRELGKNNELLWRISDDLKRVKRLTTGHPIIMGRKTHESIGRPLPNRTNIVVSRSASNIEGCVIADSIEKAIEIAKDIDQDEIFIFGGGQIYRAAFPYVERLYLTLVHAEDSETDSFFPDYSEFTKVIEKETREQDGLVYDWLTLEKES